ncbi:MAG: DUF1566 domain-containing protein [Candidatus Fermentibacteria bacterium]
MKDKRPGIVLLATIILVAGCSAMTTIVHDIERVAHAEGAVDDRFPDDGGVISDTVTGLQWRVGPDSDMDWMTANLWVENLDGEGWKMPSKEDLLGLHDAGISWNYYGPFYTEGQAVWSDSTSPHGANAWLYDFMIETGTMANTAESSGNRAFAVRSGNR